LGGSLLAPTLDVVNLQLKMRPLVELYGIRLIVCRFVKEKKKTEAPA
jgi:Sec-independent protein secretion pathway component TatC